MVINNVGFSNNHHTRSSEDYRKKALERGLMIDYDPTAVAINSRNDEKDNLSQKPKPILTKDINNYMNGLNPDMIGIKSCPAIKRLNLLA